MKNDGGLFAETMSLLLANLFFASTSGMAVAFSLNIVFFGTNLRDGVGYGGGLCLSCIVLLFGVFRMVLKTMVAFSLNLLPIGIKIRMASGWSKAARHASAGS